MSKVTSVNLDEESVNYFKRENINISAWIREMMQRRVNGGAEIDMREFRIGELEREKQGLLEQIDAIETELERLESEIEHEQKLQEKSKSFDDLIEETAKEFITYGSARKLRSSSAFKRKAEDVDMSPFELAEQVMEYRDEVLEL
jgi:hypothetical protein